MSGVSYNLGNSKPLINREQNYVLDRRLLTVHSVDRDITKYPNSNYFEIILPETMYNVQSLRLVQCNFPGQYYVFSDNYQNTQFLMNGDTQFPLKIQSGIYTPQQMAAEITTDLSFNKVVADCSYNPISQKFSFQSVADFSLNFDIQVPYTTTCNNYNTNPVMWNQYANWGLPYNLGFDKQNYNPIQNKNLFSVIAPHTANITGDTCFYMEVDKYNSYDELYPYNKSSCQMFDNNAYNGKVNSAFAKIPINSSNYINQDSRSLFLQNVVQYDPPIERIVRLIFKFRFHDGRLVDFQNNNFDFSIEFNCLKNEIPKKYNVRIPALYNL
uniref:Uncharacterized protein n=1 Tax=viral metagenome TaxID=1070528 RepID=A0A6C0HH32_9ZZZZ